MTSPSTAATEAARSLWAAAGGESGSPEAVAAAAEHLGTRLRRGLGRWIGNDGYRALLARAEALTEASRPAVRGSAYLTEGASVTLTAVRAHGPKAVGAALIALVAALIELFGRIIGDEMAIRLVEQAGSPRSPTGDASTGGHDG